MTRSALVTEAKGRRVMLLGIHQPRDRTADVFGLRHAREGEEMFARTVVGLKSGLPNTELLDLATAVTRPGGQLHLVSLIEVGRDEENARLRFVEEQLQETAGELAGRGFEVATHAGRASASAGAALARYAEEFHADVIVLGLSKRTRVGKALLGSDAQSALLSSSCPVLSVHVANE